MTSKTDSKKIDSPEFRQVCKAARKAALKAVVPGAALGILHNDEEYACGLGVTSLENPLPVTPDTLFQIGSITKTFVGLTVMRLAERGKIDIDKPVRTYLPELKLKDEAVAAAVTMRHLLTHTSGWEGDYFNDYGEGPEALSIMIEKLRELDQITAPGEYFSYCNSGFYLAGRVIEAVTHESFESVVQELVLDPLNMNRSYFFARDIITHRVVSGHLVKEGKAQTALPWFIGRAANPAGGLVCSVSELFKYARYQFGDGYPLLSKSDMAEMRTGSVQTGGSSLMGITWFLDDLSGVQMISHGGGTHGQVTFLCIVPEEHFALAILTNSSSGGKVIQAVQKTALRLFLNREIPQTKTKKRIKMNEEALHEYSGKYSNISGNMDITLHDGKLRLQIEPTGGFPTPDSPPAPAPPPANLGFYSHDRAVAVDKPLKGFLIEFLRGKDGNVHFLRAGRIRKKVE